MDIWLIIFGIAICWIGVSGLQVLSTIKKELETIRQYLQCNSLYPNASLPQATLDSLHKISEVVVDKLDGIKESLNKNSSSK